MQLSLLSTYEGGISVGQRQMFVYTASGPASYSQTNGDALSVPTGVYLDAIPPAVDTTGVYMVIFVPSVTGTRVTWTARYYTLSGMTQVANATNLAAINFQFGAQGGEF